MTEPYGETFNVETALRTIARRSDTLTSGQGDVDVAYDGRSKNWYIGVAVKPTGKRDRILRFNGSSLADVVRRAEHTVTGLF